MKGRVLIIGPEFYDYNLSIEAAFTNLGFDTRVIGYHGNMAASFGDRLKYHLSPDKEAFFGKKKLLLNNRIEATYKEFKPDLVFIVHGGDVNEHTVAGMKDCKKVLWMMDSISRSKEIYHMVKVADYNFFFEKTDVDYLWSVLQKESWFLPLAVDEKVYYPEAAARDIDILFVGALYENRMKMLKGIVSSFGDKKIKVYGTYYSPLRKPLHHLFRDNKEVFLNKNIPPAKVNKLYNRSKICLNIHHTQSRYGVNQRFFEISGAGAFQLVDANPYIKEHFSDNECMTFTSEQDMLEKIAQLLKGDHNMETMANKACDKVLSEHTFTHRIKYVLDVIKY